MDGDNQCCWPLASTHPFTYVAHAYTNTYMQSHTHIYKNFFSDGEVISPPPPKVLTSHSGEPMSLLGSFPRYWGSLMGLVAVPTNPWNLPVSTCRVLGLQMCAATTNLCKFWYWTQALLLGKVNALPTKLYPQTCDFYDNPGNINLTACLPLLSSWSTWHRKFPSPPI